MVTSKNLSGLTICLFITSIFCLSAVVPGQAQKKIGFFMPDHVDQVEIPFEEYSNLIVIPITINGQLTLKFILDTGAESAILTEKLFGDMLDLQYVRELTIAVPGIVDSLNAYVASNVRMALPGGVTADIINMLVLQEDYLKLNENLGTEIYGIIGYDIFNRFIVEINYDERKLVLTKPEHFRPRRFSEVLPLDIHHTKPYTSVLIRQGDRTDSIRLMVDSGASHAVLLDVENTHNIALPDKLLKVKLGKGLGGDIPGHIGRMSACQLDKFCFEEILVSIPAEGAYANAIKRGSRHGTLGGELLSRFQVTFDYPHERLFLQRGDQYNKKFEFDMSGLTLTATGNKLDTLVVAQVRPDTPAKRAGIKAGDVVLKIKGRNLRNTSLSEIHALLRKRDGLKINITLYREGKKIKKKFRLQKMI